MICEGVGMGIGERRSGSLGDSVGEDDAVYQPLDFRGNSVEASALLCDVD